MPKPPFTMSGGFAFVMQGMPGAALEAMPGARNHAGKATKGCVRWTVSFFRLIGMLGGCMNKKTKSVPKASQSIATFEKRMQ